MRAFVRHEFGEEENISVQYHSISVSLTYPKMSYFAYMSLSYYVSIINQTCIFYIHNFLTKQIIRIWIMIFYILYNIFHLYKDINQLTYFSNQSTNFVTKRKNVSDNCYPNIVSRSLITLYFVKPSVVQRYCDSGFLRVFSYQQQEVKSLQRRIGLIIGTLP